MATLIDAPRFSPADMRYGDPILLVEITMRGRVMRYAEQEIQDVTLPDGSTVTYHSGVEWSDALDASLQLEDYEPGSREVEIQLHLGPSVDVTDIYASGHTLGSAQASVYLYIPETGTRVPYIVDGRVVDPEWDTATLPVTMTIQDQSAEDFALWCPLDARVTDDTWPDHDPEIEDQYYPWVFGAPGYQGRSRDGSPALAVELNGVGSHVETLLIAGHDTHAADTVASVKVINASEDTDLGTFTVLATADGLGRVCSVIDITSADLADRAAGSEWYIRWHDGTDSQYGYKNHDQSAMTGAGAFLRYWFEQSSLTWDSGRLAPVLRQLDAYRIDTYVQAEPGERITPMEYARSECMPLLPVGVARGHRGFFVTHWDSTWTASAAVASLVEGANCARHSVVSVEPPLRQVYSAVEVSYDFDARDEESKRTAVLSTTLPGDVAADTAARDVRTARSSSRYSGRTKKIKTELIMDDATALRIARWVLRRHGQQHHAMSYMIDYDPGLRLEPGHIVLLTDDARQWTDRPCIIMDVSPGHEGVRVDLEMPLQDLGEAG